MTARQAGRLAHDGAVHRLWLTHFSPAVENVADVEIAARAEYPGATVGTPGLTLTLRYID